MGHKKGNTIFSAMYPTTQVNCEQHLEFYDEIGKKKTREEIKSGALEGRIIVNGFITNERRHNTSTLK